MRLAPACLAITALLPMARAADTDCDRECLRGFITQYLLAMVAHTPGAVPAAANLKFTEDTKAMKLGDGLWKNASGLRRYRQDILDVRQGVAASQVIVEESGTPVMLMLRLKVAGKKITEVETQVTRSRAEGAIFNIDALQVAGKTMSTAPDKSQLNKREDAIKIAEFYPAGLKVGSFVEVNAPFAPDAYRIENGTTTAGPGCARGGCDNIKTQTITKHPAITERPVAVDEELGIVLLRMNFGDTGSYGAGNALIVWEAFKVYGGQIHAVEAFMRVMLGQCRIGVGLSRFGLVLVAAGLASGQVFAPTGDLKFEVGTFRPTDPDTPGGGSIFPAPGGRRYTASGMTLRGLLTVAYQVKPEQIQGGPGWLDHQRWDMNAEAEKPGKLEELHIMLQNLLTEQFKLRFHYQAKRMSAYVITQDKGGAKNLRVMRGAGAGDVVLDQYVEEDFHERWTAHCASLNFLAWRLSQIFDRPVINRTNLDGCFNFVLEFTKEPPPGLEATGDAYGLPIFQALETQLGLKLDEKNAPVETMVIDHVEQPAED